jgi:hypothetical protein
VTTTQESKGHEVAAVSADTPPEPPAGATASPDEAVRMAIGMAIGNFLSVLAPEAAMLNRGYEWNYAAWHDLPQDYLQAMCEAADPLALVSIFDSIANPAALTQLKAIAASPRGAAWFNLGHNELKGWWAKLQANPLFRPEDEDENEDDL